MSQCCVPKCSNRKGGHRFPKNKVVHSQWLVAIRRDKWKPTRHSVVCRAHFKDNDYSKTNYYGNTPLKKVLKPDSVPSQFAWTIKSPTSVFARERRATKRLERLSTTTGEESTSNVPSFSEQIEVAVETPKEPEVPYRSLVSKTVNSSTQTSIRQLPPRDIHRYWNDDEAIHFYTGLESYNKFLFVLSTLGPNVHQLNYRWNVPCKTISVENCFFLTLMKLRQNKCNLELSRDFDISETMVSSIYITWINFLYCQWKEINWWPNRETVRFYHPHNFNSPKTRVIYDGTEFPIQKPKNPIDCQSSFSTYKNKNTFKVIVGASPGGLVTCITPAYGGSTSDRQIVSKEMLHTTCDPGDTVMADKGFNVQDLFAPYDVGVSIPTFLSGTSQLPARAVISDRKLSNKRVHIERVIGLTKTYKILRTPLQSSDLPLASRISFVCAVLCNFRRCIMPPRG